MAAPASLLTASRAEPASPVGSPVTSADAAKAPTRLRLVRPVASLTARGLTSPVVYAALDLRRRRAQIAARRLLRDRVGPSRRAAEAAASPFEPFDQ